MKINYYLLKIANRQLLARKRQSIVSLMGIVLGVAFFLAISALMRGSENDFIKRLVDNSPHITIVDEFRTPKKQPVQEYYSNKVIEIRSLKPEVENRGLRNYPKILAFLRETPGLLAAAVLSEQALISFSGKERSITLNGMEPKEIRKVTSIGTYMVQGGIDSLIENPNGIIIGLELAKKMSINLGGNITLISSAQRVQNFKVVGFFKTGRSNVDTTQAYISLKKTQNLSGKTNRVNSIIIKVSDPSQAKILSEKFESIVGYKSISWQENSEDLMNTVSIRNKIMFTVVLAVLVVAAFGIYNVISTVVLEKKRDIAILKSMGFYASDIQKIFLIQGVVLGLVGCILGLPLGSILIYSLSNISFKPPGSTEKIQMPVDWAGEQFLLAAAFALTAATLAAYLPARKAAKVDPVDILRGSAG